VIGVFGGTFDPVHFGHLRAALEVQQRLDLDEVRFVPLRWPPHRAAPVLGAAERHALLRAALLDAPRFRLDDRELRRAGPSYTLDTLRTLRAELGHGPLCLLLGSDAFNGFAHWRQPREILELAHLVVMRRPDAAPLTDPCASTLLAERGTDDPRRLRADSGGWILNLEITPLAISATAIRALLERGLSPRYLLPEAVLAMIQARGWYGASLPVPGDLG
jgi:nicotinate-nucleotide adenylyltransferase